MGCGSSRESLRKEGADNFNLVGAQFLPAADFAKLEAGDKLAPVESNEANAKKVATELKAHHAEVTKITDEKATAVFGKFAVKDALEAITAALAALKEATGLEDFVLAAAAPAGEAPAAEAKEGGVADLAAAIVKFAATSEYFRLGLRSASLKKEQGADLGLSAGFETAAAVFSHAVKAGAEATDFFVGGFVSAEDLAELKEINEKKGALYFPGVTLGHADAAAAAAAAKEYTAGSAVVFKFNREALKSDDSILVYRAIAQIDSIVEPKDDVKYTLVTLKKAEAAAAAAPTDAAKPEAPAAEEAK